MSTKPKPAVQFFEALSLIRSSGAGVPETSYYPALSRLLDEIGRTLKPKVACIINPASQGAGIPDGGFYTADQLRKVPDRNNPPPDLVPTRGVLEVKPPSHALSALIQSEQVAKYFNRYGLVLVTNLRAFALIGSGPDGQPETLEPFELAPDEKSFNAALAHPHKMAREQGPRLEEYLARVLTHNAPLKTPQDVARLLASYARDAKSRIETGDLETLTYLKTALENSLGLHFEGDKGEHFFRSTLIQTLFYGIFSAWVIHARHRLDAAAKKPRARAVRESAAAYNPASDFFDWRQAGFLLRVPMIKALFNVIVHSRELEDLRLIEVLDWADAALNRIDARLFFEGFEENHAVQYFYEPFLAEFDPDLRKELGVWYTPAEIVDYQVERVDSVLRSELGIADGLADPKVVVLDPCCGTGAYLCSVLRRIHKTFSEKGADDLAAHYLKKAAIQRIYGFEIMPAPFVVAHLQLGLLLESLGAPFDDKCDERPGVFLTNSLTGWDLALDNQKKQLPSPIPEFNSEKFAAEKVKREKPILVILGNPPYNAFADLSPNEEGNLIADYKKGLVADWKIKKFNLDDLYIRFFRIAEKRIAEHGGRGVVSFISNFSYLGDPSYVVMRQSLTSHFDRLWFDCLNGDSRETGKLTPEGKPDPSVFSTEWSREGIRVGTAITTLVRKTKEPKPQVFFRQFWGTKKRKELLASLDAKDFDAQYQSAEPNEGNRYSFKPSEVTTAYLTWPKLNELCGEQPITGFKENRGFSLIDDNRDALSERMRIYLDKSRNWDEIREYGWGFTKDAARFNAQKARERVLSEETYLEERLRRYLLRPFELKWGYYSPVRPLWNEPRPSLFLHAVEQNSFLVSRPDGVAKPEGFPIFWTNALGDFDFIRGHAYHFPLRLKDSAPHKTSRLKDKTPVLLDEKSGKLFANLSPLARSYLAGLGLPDPDADATTAELIWMHALAIGYSPAYISENTDGIRQDWPRIPLPKEKAAFLASAALGRQVAALLDTEALVNGVTTGNIRADLRDIAVFRRADGQSPDIAGGDLELTAGWGHGGKGGVTMPGRGKIADQGNGMLDIFLNERTCWRNVPQAVWDFTIGGYQVIKKWLSYREKELLKRSLTTDEVRYVTEMARRLAALLALHPALDANYRATAQDNWEINHDRKS